MKGNTLLLLFMAVFADESFVRKILVNLLEFLGTWLLQYITMYLLTHEDL